MGYKDENQEKESFWKDPPPTHTHTLSQKQLYHNEESYNTT